MNPAFEALAQQFPELKERLEQLSETQAQQEKQSEEMRQLTLAKYRMDGAEAGLEAAQAYHAAYQEAFQSELTRLLSDTSWLPEL